MPLLGRDDNLVERFFNKLKHFRAIATRFEKHADNYLALVKLAASKIWMRFMSRWPRVDWLTIVRSMAILGRIDPYPPSAILPSV